MENEYGFKPQVLTHSKWKKIFSAKAAQVNGGMKQLQKSRSDYLP